jgi:hypothetical protein
VYIVNTGKISSRLVLGEDVRPLCFWPDQGVVAPTIASAGTRGDVGVSG